MTKVTAIITTKNRLPLLKEAIYSVLNQTYKNIEMIVVDDESTDGTEDFMRDISIKENIIYIRINPSKGSNNARNTAIKKSSGEYIALLDDDDQWMPEKIEKQVDMLDKNTDIGVVYTGIKYILNNNLELDVFPSKEDRGDCSNKIFSRFIGITSNLMIRKNILDSINYFDENVNFLEDYDLMIRICQITKVDFINECLIKYKKDLTDKQRKTNQIKEWEESLEIEYFNKKYKKNIDNLCKKDKEKRMVLIYDEYANRYGLNNMPNKKRKYLYKIYKITKSFKHLIKFILNIETNKTFIIKARIKKIKKYFYK